MSTVPLNRMVQKPVKLPTQRNEFRPPSVPDSEKERYRQLLHAWRLSGQSDPLPNLRPWQCTIALEELLLLADELQIKSMPPHSSEHKRIIIRILTGCCPAHVYGGIDFTPFLLKGGGIQILVWNESAGLDENPFNGFDHRFPGQVFVRFADKPIESPPISHFVVVDEVAYRLEAPHDKFDVFTDMEPEIRARLNFNDGTGAQLLAEAFDAAWNKAEESLSGTV